MVEGVSFMIGVWLRATFEDGQKENTLSKIGHGYLMITYESIEISEFCPSSQYSCIRQILAICNRVYVVIIVLQMSSML